MSTIITLFHVSSSLRNSLVVKTAKTWGGCDDYEGVYLSFSLHQASLWAMQLTQNRGVEFQYFYQVEVPKELLFEKGIDSLIPWQGEELEEVIYVGPPLTELKLLESDFYWDGYDCYLNGEKIEFLPQDYGEYIDEFSHLSDEEVMALIG